MDWDDLRVFVAAARAGSLSVTAKRLGVSVATVGRRLDRLEDSLERRLFLRDAGGLRPTDEALRLLERAEGVAESVSDFLRMASAASKDEGGVVTISTVETIATHVIAPSLGAFRTTHPHIGIVVRSDPMVVRLSSRKADVALRLVRPDEARAVTRKLATVRFGIYASESYLARRGWPSSPRDDLRGHDVVGWDPRYGTAPEARWMQDRLQDEEVMCRFATAAGIHAACLGGAGIGMLPTFMAKDLIQLVGPEDLPERQIWLVVHEDLKDVPYVRAVVDHLAKVVKAAEQAG